MVFIIESQIAYILDALARMRTDGLATVQPTAEAQRRWNVSLQRRLARTVWSTGGCSSWYLDAHGRNTTLWPGTTFTFRARLAKFDPAAYLTTRRSPSASPSDSSTYSTHEEKVVSA
jgi:cyclohexanone monooxygenase